MISAMTKLLFVGSEIRHELGCAASLALLGYDVIYFHIGSKFKPLSWVKTYLDYACLKVKTLEIPHSTLFQALLHEKSLIPEAILQYNPDVVISTPSVPYYIGKYLAKLSDAPLILRVWGVRANKLVEHIVYGKNYFEIIGFIPSIIHMLNQVYGSRIVITLDNSTMKFIKSLARLKRVKLIYPTYAALYEYERAFTHSSLETTLPEVIQTEGYILGMVTMSKTGPVFKLEQQPLFNILYRIAKKLKDVNVIICCGTREEAVRKFKVKPPKNMEFIPSGVPDDVLKLLYEKSLLVVIPVFFKSVSNRLLEALFYKKPILTNSIALELHPELRDCVIVSNNYDRYPEIIRKLLKQDNILDELKQRVKTIWDKFFGSKVQAREMLKVIREVI
jgi:hypothetical protein